MKHVRFSEQDFFIERIEIDDETTGKDVDWKCDRGSFRREILSFNKEEQIDMPLALINKALENRQVRIRGLRPAAEMKEILDRSI